MKINQILSSPLLPSGLAALSVALTLPSQAELVAHYEFEDNGDDSAGNADGTLGTEVTFAPGLIGQAAVFGTAGIEGVNTIDATAFDPGSGDFSVTFWIKRAEIDQANADGIFDALNNTGEGFQANLRRLPGEPTSDPNNHMGFRIDDSSGQFVLIVDPGEIDDTEEWHHFALTIDRTANEAKIYRDGELAVTASTAILTGAISPDRQISIGGLNNNGTLGLDGQLDDLRFYDEALNAAAIAELATPPNPVLPIPLEITEISLTDSSVTLTWNSKQSGTVSYRILYSEDLATPLVDWFEANDSIGSGGTETSYTLTGVELPPVPLPGKLFFVVEEN